MAVIRPYDKDYRWFQDFEERVNQALGHPAPTPTEMDLVAWRVDEMRRALTAKDWQEVLIQSQRLSKMLEGARNRPSQRRSPWINRGAALGRVATHAKRARAGKAALS